MSEMERALIVLYRSFRQFAEECKKGAQDTDPDSQWWACMRGMAGAYDLSAQWLRGILERSGLNVDSEEEAK